MKSAAELQTAMIGAVTRANTTLQEQAQKDREAREARLKSEKDLKRAAEILDAVPALIEQKTLEGLCGATVMNLGRDDHYDLIRNRPWISSSAGPGFLIGAAKLVYDRLLETGFEVRIGERKIDINWGQMPKPLS